MIRVKELTIINKSTACCFICFSLSLFCYAFSLFSTCLSEIELLDSFLDQVCFSSPDHKIIELNNLLILASLFQVHISIILREVLKGLDYLHTERKLHRDIKVSF